jgi:hypothetical protein
MIVCQSLQPRNWQNSETQDAGSFLSAGASIPSANIITISTNELFDGRLWILLVAPIRVTSYNHMQVTLTNKQPGSTVPGNINRFGPVVSNVK